MSTPPEDQGWLDTGKLLEDPKLPAPKKGRPENWVKHPGADYFGAARAKERKAEKAISSDPPPLRKESEADPAPDALPVRSLWVRDPEDSRPPLRPATPEEIRADTLPDPIVERLIYEGIPTLFVGLSKQGKSYAAAQLALCVASGKPFLGLRVERSRVLYISWEVILAGLLSRMENIARDAGLPDPNSLIDDGWLLFYAHSSTVNAARLDLGQREDWARLYEMITGPMAPELVIVDTLRKTVPRVEHNADIDWSEALDRFNLLSRDTGIAQLIVDHGNRDREDSSAASFPIGSQVKGSEMACVVKLTRRRKDGESDRWRLDVDSWYDDPATPIWYERPVDQEGELGRGCGCVLCDAPVDDSRKGTVANEMERWLRERLQGGVAVGNAAIYEEAAAKWPGIDSDTRERKLRRAHDAIGGDREDVKGVKARQTVWTLG